MTNSFPTRRSSDLAETLPSVQRTAVSVTDQGDGNRPSINADIRADPANALSRLGGDMLQQRHVAAEIATLGHPAAKPLGRRNGDKRANGRIAVGPNTVEAKRRARDGIPDDARQRIGERAGRERYGERTEGGGVGKECGK